MAKYKTVTYKKGSFCGGINMNLNLITCEDKSIILSIIQSYVLDWYHIYLLHPEMYITESTILQRLYWPSIGNSVRKEVTNCDTCQHTKESKIKYGKSPAKESEEIRGTNYVYI